MTPDSPPLLLGSSSPRRRQLLAMAGFDVQVQSPDIDDGELIRGNVSPHLWVQALAWFKAAQIAAANPDHLVLTADTVCSHDGRVLGQPRDRDHAREMLMQMRGETHHTITGVCLIPPGDGPVRRRRHLFVDDAAVTIGDLGDDAIAAYLETDGWRGKAGAYNLSERIDDGWPITCEGDPTTVMGLPMQRLGGWIAEVLATPHAPGRHRDTEH